MKARGGNLPFFILVKGSGSMFDFWNRRCVYFIIYLFFMKSFMKSIFESMIWSYTIRPPFDEKRYVSMDTVFTMINITKTIESDLE